jgi:hypothetical protein
VPQVYYLYQAFYSSHKNNPDIFVNHVILFRLLRDLLGSERKDGLQRNVLNRYFILWFCHVIPLHIYLSPRSTFSNKKRAFKEMLYHPEFLAWRAEVKDSANTSLFQRVILVAYGLQSPLIVYSTTAVNHFLKYKLKLNYKKIYYQNANAL